MSLSNYLISNLREQKILENITKRNIIQLDHYFKYSGKQEVNNKLVALVPEYRKERMLIKNDMSKYKLKKHYEPRK
jgi:hypothetical protein